MDSSGTLLTIYAHIYYPYELVLTISQGPLYTTKG